ncbi:PREDICTED: diphosphomevalonate decarboxylase [Nicrophorus vespilloides]|uniref:Diphosphomevalonate decarboxylase n=1 Tax=Nicrophorus vespilloides TaxID=110193 RepID=A0ABM1MTW0_NICVS|nr:PREDICTED: diphosphomevalonate decarboxylase [Nicrophorus vespilloides]
MKVVTCIAPVNIAVIKYWGKRDEDLILPINDSISATLSMDHMCAKTTIMCSPDFEDSKFWLNGVEQSLESKRLVNCLQEIKRLASAEPSNAEMLRWNIRICSENNFPTAAGLASSAAGYACLVTALANLYGVKTDLSALARRGSGSACRSIYGGWVQWHMGCNPDGSDSIARVIEPSIHWPEMRILVLVVNDARKKYSSTTGMNRSVATSDLIKHRACNVVPKRVTEMREAIKTKDFNKFAEITMKDSNQFHAIALDTHPPCVYMNDTSHAISDMIHAYNEHKGVNKVAYTFDAGPNACLYLLESEVAEVLSLINECFPSTVAKSDYLRGIPLNIEKSSDDLKFAMNLQVNEPNLLKYIIYTKVGEGAQVLDGDHLLTMVGLPKNTI